MNLQQIKWPVMVATMAVTLAALFGAGFIVKSRTVDEPLRKLYAEMPAVESSTWERGDEAYEIKVKLKQTTDLQATYKKLDDETKKIMKGVPYTITVEDHRSAKLEEMARRMNLYVQEALSTGHFAAMADRVEEEAAKVGVKARMTVDNRKVYLEMEEQGNYLYSVVERPEAKSAEPKEGGFGL